MKSLVSSWPLPVISGDGLAIILSVLDQVGLFIAAKHQTPHIKSWKTNAEQNINRHPSHLCDGTKLRLRAPLLNLHWPHCSWRGLWMVRHMGGCLSAGFSSQREQIIADAKAPAFMRRIKRSGRWKLSPAFNQQIRPHTRL
jgi:hypothetical protein